MSSSEISCSSCNFIFNDNQLYNIHLKNCSNNHNTDLKNKYYCPICNRQFRLLSNLLRHTETRKHQELLEWNVNKNSSGPNHANIKTISVNLTDDELESTSRKNQSKTFDLDLPQELSFQSKYTENFNISESEKDNIKDNIKEEMDGKLDEDLTDDLFFSNLKNTFKDSEQLQTSSKTPSKSPSQSPPPPQYFDFEEKEKISYNSGSIIKLDIKTIDNIVNNKPQEDTTDNFLANLVKEREKALASFTNTNPQENQIKTNLKDTKKDIKSKNMKNDRIVGFKLQEDNEINLKNEIDKAKIQINHKLTDEKEESCEIDNLEENDNLLDNIQSLRSKVMSNLSSNLDSTKKINTPVNKQINDNIIKQNTKQLEYPESFHNLPIWKNLQVIIKNNQAPKLLVSLLIQTPVMEYPKICTFVYFSKELKENKELKINMVKAMIEVQNHLTKLFNQRQTVWNGKHIPLTLNLMNKWKLTEFLNTLL